jgi:hypothetical protein
LSGYPEEVLASFDLVIASIHSKFRMSRKEQTDRIVKAVESSYTTVLGHVTGRQLLRRPGYEVDMERVLIRRVPAGPVDQAVIEQIRRLVRAPEIVAHTIRPAGIALPTPQRFTFHAWVRRPMFGSCTPLILRSSRRLGRVLYVWTASGSALASIAR